MNRGGEARAELAGVAAAFLVFVGGFIVMVLEIVGARYLASEFGGSFYVWVSQIGVVMIALAAGYYLGGMLADLWQRLKPLALILIPAGVLVLGVPVYSPTLLEAIVMRHPPREPVALIWQKLDPALGSAVVFLLPCLALATLTPYLIRLSAASLGHLGRLSGRIIAWSTLGSIAGVFFAGYIFLDVMRVSNIFRAMGVLTILLGLSCWPLDRAFAQDRTRGDDEEP